ncbi:MAG: DNA uptake protein ComE-like DNA-binding protein [Verrucomicrobiales bacterium]|jgi:DNA uptake protein ComE-like DNA-binding protein
MKRLLIGITILASCAVNFSAFAADEKEKGSAKPTVQEKEILAAEEFLDELSSTDKGKLTKLINSGTLKELIALPGIGRVTAELIIEARPLESTAHIVAVKNIGLKTMEKIVEFVDDGGLSAPPSDSKAKAKSKSTKAKS